jgi:hypothetical protein
MERRRKESSDMVNRVKKLFPVVSMTIEGGTNLLIFGMFLDELCLARGKQFLRESKVRFCCL